MPALVFALSFGIVAATVSAATTISTNISTEGTLAVTGASTLTGAVSAASTLAVTGAATLSSTLGVTGLTSLSTASTTGAVSVAGALWVGGNATTTAAGAISTESSLTVSGATVLNGGLTMDTNKFTVADTTGNTSIGGTLGVTGLTSLTTASSTELVTLDSLELTSTLDALVADAALTIGGTKAGAIAFGRTGETVTFPGNLTVTGTFSPAITTVSGDFTIGADRGLDTDAAGQLNIGTSTANAILIGGSGTTTTIAGPLTANELATFGASASTTGNLSVSGLLWVGGNATTTAAGAILTEANIAAGGGYGGGSGSVLSDTGDLSMNGNLIVDGTSALDGGASTTNASLSGALWVGGNATTTAAGNISTSGTLDVGGGTAVNSLVFGYCTISNSANIVATSTAYFDCTGATGVATTHRVFVQATSSLPAEFVVQAASSTAADTINLRIFNTGYRDGVGIGATAPGAISLNFWAVR